MNEKKLIMVMMMLMDAQCQYQIYGKHYTSHIHNVFVSSAPPSPFWEKCDKLLVIIERVLNTIQETLSMLMLS